MTTNTSKKYHNPIFFINKQILAPRILTSCFFGGSVAEGKFDIFYLMPNIPALWTCMTISRRWSHLLRPVARSGSLGHGGGSLLGGPTHGWLGHGHARSHLGRRLADDGAGVHGRGAHILLGARGAGLGVGSGACWPGLAHTGSSHAGLVGRGYNKTHAHNIRGWYIT